MNWEWDYDHPERCENDELDEQGETPTNGDRAAYANAAVDAYYLVTPPIGPRPYRIFSVTCTTCQTYGGSIGEPRGIAATSTTWPRGLAGNGRAF